MNNNLKSNISKVFDKFIVHKFKSNIITYGNEFKGIKLNNIQTNEIYFNLIVDKSINDYLDIFNIGAAGTLLDIITTISISGYDKKMRKNVSIDMNIQYLNNLKGKEIIIKCYNFIYNSNTAICNADIYDDNIICISSIHTKALL